MNPIEEASGIIWCKPADGDKIRSRITAEIKDIIWSDKIPSILPSMTSQGIEMFIVKLVHGGDIFDDNLLATMLVKIASFFDNCYVRFDVTEGDLFLIESASRDNDDFDIEEGCSIAYKNELYRIDEQYSKSNNAPLMIKDGDKYPEQIQSAFKYFCDSTKNEKIYYNMRLNIPKKLMRFILFDPSNISVVVKNAEYKTKVDYENTEMCDFCIKFRRYQLALLDTNRIKICRGFIDKYVDETPRFIRLSYLMLCAYEKMMQDENCAKQINRSNESDFDYLEETDALKEDKDLSWLDDTTKPDGDIEAIGSEMAERFTSFVKEMSEFDKVDDDGPINFNFDTFSSKLAHFLDSTDDENEEEEEEEEDQFMKQLAEDEDKQLHEISKGRGDPVEYATAYWNESLDSQPTYTGPAQQYANLFNMKK